MKTSRKFATSPDILVAKGKHSVANATVLVAISSPAIENRQVSRVLLTYFIFYFWLFSSGNHAGFSFYQKLVAW